MAPKWQNFAPEEFGKLNSGAKSQTKYSSNGSKRQKTTKGHTTSDKLADGNTRITAKSFFFTQSKNVTPRSTYIMLAKRACAKQSYLGKKDALNGMAAHHAVTLQSVTKMLKLVNSGDFYLLRVF